MKNTVKIGDLFTINADAFTGPQNGILRDCTKGELYKCQAVGSGNRAPDVEFTDDAGDVVLFPFWHVTVQIKDSQ